MRFKPIHNSIKSTLDNHIGGQDDIHKRWIKNFYSFHTRLLQSKNTTNEIEMTHEIQLNHQDRKKKKLKVQCKSNFPPINNKSECLPLISLHLIPCSSQWVWFFYTTFSSKHHYYNLNINLHYIWSSGSWSSQIKGSSLQKISTILMSRTWVAKLKKCIYQYIYISFETDRERGERCRTIRIHQIHLHKFKKCIDTKYP